MVGLILRLSNACRKSYSSHPFPFPALSHSVPPNIYIFPNFWLCWQEGNGLLLLLLSILQLTPVNKGEMGGKCPNARVPVETMVLAQ